MRGTTRVLCVIAVAAAVGATGCEKEPAAGPAPTAKDLLGAWSGSMVHQGEEQMLALEVEPAEDGKVSLRMTLPVLGLARQPIGAVEPAIDGTDVGLGPFVLTYDGGADTLTRTMPASMAPVYEIPVTLRRVEAVEVPTRPEPTAPLAAPVWTFDAGAAVWAGARFADGVVYAGDDEGRLHALVAWGQPAVTTERVFVGTAALRGYLADAHRGGVMAMGRATGQAVWRYAADRPEEGAWGFPGSPAVGAGRVFVTGIDGRVLAFAQ